MLEVIVDKLPILAAMAPPKSFPSSSTRIFTISAAPSAVLPNSLSSSLDLPRRSCNIPVTLIPLSEIMFSSSRPIPPAADLCTNLIMASNVPSWSTDTDAVSANVCNISIFGSIPADLSAINALVAVSIWKGVVCANSMIFFLAFSPSATPPKTVFKDVCKSSKPIPT